MWQETKNFLSEKCRCVCAAGQASNSSATTTGSTAPTNLIISTTRF